MNKILLLALLVCAPLAFAKDTASAHHSGIAGQVVLFRCPVSGPFECPPYPYQGVFSIFNDKGKLVEKVEPEEDGFFAVKLKPGNCRIVPDPPRPSQIYPLGLPAGRKG